MKRDHSDESDCEDSPDPKVPREEEMEAIHGLQEGIMGSKSLNQRVKEQLQEVQKNYFTNFLGKILDKVPLGRQVLEQARENGTDDSFVYMYASAKMLVATHLAVKRQEALASVNESIAFYSTKFVHDKFIRPILVPLVSEDQLDLPLSIYSKTIETESNKSEMELQCLLHTIQETLDSQDQTIRVVNPLKAQMAQQLKAVCNYIVQVLMTLSKPLQKPVQVLHQGEIFNEIIAN